MGRERPPSPSSSDTSAAAASPSRFRFLLSWVRLQEMAYSQRASSSAEAVSRRRRAISRFLTWTEILGIS